MPYAEGRLYHDADSHLMETRGWLERYADADIRESIRPLHLDGGGRLAEQAVEQAEQRRRDEQALKDMEAGLMINKGWSALGAFDPTERSRALDLLGFASQLVFSTFAPNQFWGSEDLDVVYGGTRAHNRAMVDFCAHDPRLLPVGFVPFNDAERAVAATREAIELGCAAVHVPSAPPPRLSPTHPDFDGVWGALAEAGVPFVLHIGGGGRTIRPQFHENGRARPTDFLGGGENIRAKDYMTLYYSPETFLSCLALDGVFEAHPGLKAGVIELGAMFVPSWLRRLDIAHDTFAKTEPELRKLTMKASDYIRRQVKFTPFPTEPVGWLIEQGCADLLMFSSDYPHPEGGRNPLKRFEESMVGVSERDRDKFYSGNFADLMGSLVPA
jgi:predicted TIM-barrel fold metal-dependent hydrolase